MEGSKGGSRGSGLWFVEKKPMQQRWDEYVATRMALGLPVEGSFSLFKEVWMAHPEIRQRGAKVWPAYLRVLGIDDRFTLKL